MKLSAVLGAWRSRLRPQAPARPRVQLQAVGLTADELLQLRPLVRQAGERLGLELALDKAGGDIVIVDSAFASHVAPQLLQSYCEERPMVSLDASRVRRDAVVSALQLMQARQQELLRQLCDIPLVQRASTLWGESGWAPQVLAPAEAVSSLPADEDSGFDAQFDSSLGAPMLSMAPELDEVRQRVLGSLLQGRDNPARPPLCLTYGPDAHLRVDFELGRVSFDVLALQQLRVRALLPMPAGDERPGPDAINCSLEQTLWDIGLACGPYRLLERPVTPSQLRHHARVSLSELRRFIQASLFVGVACWDLQARKR